MNYQAITDFLSRYFRKDQLFKHGFNLSPMYRRSCGRVVHMTQDLLRAEIKIKLNYKNKNYVGAMFGGSMFSATDPIYMIQLLQILGKQYVVWDKAATIRYKRPAYQHAIAVFEFTKEEIERIKRRVVEEQEIDLVKTLNITNQSGDIYAELDKTIYVASKQFYKEKMAKRAKK